MMMKTTHAEPTGWSCKCPYCGHYQEACGDNCDPTGNVIECWKCEKEFEIDRIDY